jgi:hypothetical protein
MTKIENIRDPNSCWNKARASQHIFVLHDEDPCMADTIRVWASMRIVNGINKLEDDKIQSALREADEIDRQNGITPPVFTPPQVREGSGVRDG